MLLTKLNHYGICGILNDWFKSYLSNHNQYISISGYDSGLTAKNLDISQGSYLGPLLFLLQISDLNQAIKFCKIHHFVHDTDVMLNTSYKQLK